MPPIGLLLSAFHYNVQGVRELGPFATSLVGQTLANETHALINAHAEGGEGLGNN